MTYAHGENVKVKVNGKWMLAEIIGFSGYAILVYVFDTGKKLAVDKKDVKR